MSFPGILPTEVFEAIIDQARDHRPSLRHLALSHRAFLPRARYHLFSRIVITSKEKLESVPAFLHPRPWLAPLVVCVTIRDYVYRTPYRLLDVVPAHLLTQLPNLRRFELESDLTYSEALSAIPSRHLIAHNARALSALRNLSIHIRQLELCRIFFLDADDLVRLLCAFPTLDTLVCTSISINRRLSPRASKAGTRDKAPPLIRLTVRFTEWRGCPHGLNGTHPFVGSVSPARPRTRHNTGARPRYA